MSKSFNFRKVGGRQYRSWKAWVEGDTMIARYIKAYEDQFGHTCHEVEVLETDFSETDDNIEEGKLFGVNYCGSIDFKLKEVCKGDIIQIVYEGTGTVDKGPMKGKDYHMVDVAVDDSHREESPEQVESEDVEEHDL